MLGKSGKTGSCLNPFVFIVGCPRSGTTLLQRIVNSHPQIAITPETHWIPDVLKEETVLLPEGWVTPHLLSWLSVYRSFAKLEIGVEELAALLRIEEKSSYAHFVTGIFDLYGKARGKPLVGDKTPGYVRNIRLLHSLWPRAKFVHLIRDGRDVCLSAINWKGKVSKLVSQFPTWREDSVSTAALWWERHVRLGRGEARLLGTELYYEIRYESLVACPEYECAQLCDFLDVPFNDVMLQFHQGRTKIKPGLDAKHAWLPITPGLRDWRAQMAVEDIERFEAMAGELLDELAYTRLLPDPRPDAQKHAAKIRGQFPKEICDVGAFEAD